MLAQERESTDYINEAAQIFNTIFHKYKADVPPVKNYPKPLVLGVNVEMSHVLDLDIPGQYMESTIELLVVMITTMKIQ